MLEVIADINLVGQAMRILGLALLSLLIGGIAAAVFRWYAGMPLSEGIAILLGLSAVALWLNTTATLGAAIGETEIEFDEVAAAFTLITFAVGAISADIGRRGGEYLGRHLAGVSHIPRIDANVGQLIKAKGSVLRVKLPEEIEDIEGYDRIDDATKAEIADTVLLFPRRITVDELRERIVERLQADYGVGHVDIELTANGTVEYLAVGERMAGIGPTLAPGTVAVPIRADPAFSASPGDVVQIWQVKETPQRIARGEFRGSAEDIVTVVVESEVATSLDPETQYRLLTLPSDPPADREFASLLRSAAETMGAVTVSADSDLVGMPVTALPGTVVAIKDEHELTPLPTASDRIDAGDTVYLIGRPEVLRRVTASAGTQSREPLVPDQHG